MSFTRRTVESFYTRLVNQDRSNIDQDLRLRMVPAAFTFRVLPFGQDRGFQPYVGGGLNVIAWRYSESGQFVGTDMDSGWNVNGCHVGRLSS